MKYLSFLRTLTTMAPIVFKRRHILSDAAEQAKGLSDAESKPIICKACADLFRGIPGMEAVVEAFEKTSRPALVDHQMVEDADEVTEEV